MMSNIELYQQLNQENAMKHGMNDTQKREDAMALPSALGYVRKYALKGAQAPALFESEHQACHSAGSACRTTCHTDLAHRAKT